MKTIAIIGSGSWGVALGIHLAKLGNKVNIWSFLEEERDIINNEKRCKFLPEAIIPDGIYCSTDYKEVIDNTAIFAFGISSKITSSNVFKDSSSNPFEQITIGLSPTYFLYSFTMFLVNFDGVTCKIKSAL